MVTARRLISLSQFAPCSRDCSLSAVNYYSNIEARTEGSSFASNEPLVFLSAAICNATLAPVHDPVLLDKGKESVKF